MCTGNEQWNPAAFLPCVRRGSAVTVPSQRLSHAESAVVTQTLRRDLLIFVMVSYGWSWTCWIGLTPFIGTDPTSTYVAQSLGTFGPALAAMLLFRGASPAVSRSLVVAAGIAILALGIWINWSRWTAAEASRHPGVVKAGLVVLTVLPVIVVWFACRRWAALRRRRTKGSPSRRRVLLATLVAGALFPLLIAVAVAVSDVLGIATVPAPLFTGWPAALQMLPEVVLSTLAFGGPLGEEPGWRGYALAQLQRRYSPAVASVVIGVVWGLWHAPLHLTGMYAATMGAGVPSLLLRVVSSIGLSVIFTWLFNLSAGSLTVVIALHTMLNCSVGFLMPRTPVTDVVIAAVVAILIVGARMYKRRPQDIDYPDSGNQEGI